MAFSYRFWQLEPKSLVEEAGISLFSIGGKGGELPIGILGLRLVLGRCGFERNYWNVLGNEF